MPVRYSEESSGPSTRRAQQGGVQVPAQAEEPVVEEHGPHYYEDIETTGAAAELADELGVDLSDIEGTGKGGRITKADVQKAASA